MDVIIKFIILLLLAKNRKTIKLLEKILLIMMDRY